MRTPDTGAIILPSSPPDILAVSRPSYVTRDLQHSVHLLLVSTGSPFIILDSGRVEAGHYSPPVSRGTHDTSHMTQGVWSLLLAMCHAGHSGLTTANVSRGRGTRAACHRASGRLLPLSWDYCTQGETANTFCQPQTWG